MAELLADDLRRGVHARKVMDSYQIRKAEALAERFEQRDYCAELHRLRGVLLTTLGAGDSQIEASFCAALPTARKQQSTSPAEVGRTVSDPAEIDEEIHTLCEALIATEGRLGP